MIKDAVKKPAADLPTPAKLRGGVSADTAPEASAEAADAEKGSE